MRNNFLSIFSTKHIICFVSLLSFSFGLINAQIITTIAGNGVIGSSGDGGPASDAELWGPNGVFLDKTGNIYIADQFNNKIRIITTAGIINTVAGNGFNPGGHGGYSGDGGQATDAELYVPQHVFLDKTGNMYITDTRNDRIRMVNTSGIITTIAGNGITGFSGDGGMATAAEFSSPASSCIDSLGNLFITDENNGRVRKINTSGIINTIAGGGLQKPGDGGPATAAYLGGSVDGISADDSGNIYFSVFGGDYNKIRKVNTSGIIFTVAGIGAVGFYGDGGPATDAELYSPVAAFYTDAFNHLIISDAANYRVRMVSSSGIINTIIGNGIMGFSGDGGPATDAEINLVEDMFEDKLGNLYVADAGNNRIREIPDFKTNIDKIDNETILLVYPNPVNQTLNLNFNRQITTGLATLSIMDITGSEVLSFVKSSNTLMQIDVSSLSPGMYFISLKTKDTYFAQKFIKY